MNTNIAKRKKSDIVNEKSDFEKEQPNLQKKEAYRNVVLPGKEKDFNTICDNHHQNHCLKL